MGKERLEHIGYFVLIANTNYSYANEQNEFGLKKTHVFHSEKKNNNIKTFDNIEQFRMRLSLE